jgi:hypothetical protein
MANPSLGGPEIIAVLPEVMDQLLAIVARGLVVEAFLMEVIEQGVAPALLGEAMAAAPGRAKAIAEGLDVSPGVMNQIGRVIRGHVEGRAKVFSGELKARLNRPVPI